MNLKKIRNQQNLSIRALSELSAVPIRTIEDIERFNRCKVDTAIKLADALNVTLDELCRDKVDEWPPFPAFLFLKIFTPPSPAAPLPM